MTPNISDWFKSSHLALKNCSDLSKLIKLKVKAYPIFNENLSALKRLRLALILITMIAMANRPVDSVYSPEMNSTIANIINAATLMSLCKFFIYCPHRVKHDPTITDLVSVDNTQFFR